MVSIKSQIGYNNQLIRLNKLPESLTILFCYNTQLLFTNLSEFKNTVASFM